MNKGRRETLNGGITEHPKLALLYLPEVITQQLKGFKSFLKRLAPFHRTDRQGENTDDPTEIH